MSINFINLSNYHLLAQQPQVIKARAYNPESAYDDPSDLSIPTKYIPQACSKKIKQEEVLENLVYLSKNTALTQQPTTKK